LTDVVAIAAGYSHSLALKRDGTVVRWGNDFFGKGNVPLGLTNVVAIAAGDSHSLALKHDGTVVGWGENNFGQRDVPPGLTDVVAIAAGYRYSLALQRNGTVVPWGDLSFRQKEVPTGLTNVTTIAAGDNHSLAPTEMGAGTAPKDVVVAETKANPVEYMFLWASQDSDRTEFVTDHPAKVTVGVRIAGTPRSSSPNVVRLDVYGEGSQNIYVTYDKPLSVDPSHFQNGKQTIWLDFDVDKLPFARKVRFEATVVDPDDPTSMLAHAVTSYLLYTPEVLARDSWLRFEAMQWLSGQMFTRNHSAAVIGTISINGDVEPNAPLSTSLSLTEPISLAVVKLSVYGDASPETTFVITKAIALPLWTIDEPPTQHGTLILDPVPLPDACIARFDLTLADAADSETILALATQTYPIDRRDVAAPNLYFVSIDFLPSGEGAPPFDLIASPNGDAFAAAVLPVAAENWRYWAANDDVVHVSGTDEISPIFVPDYNPECPPALVEIDSDDRLSLEEGSYVFCRLASIRNRIVNNGVGPTELSFVHGWIYDPTDREIVVGNGAAKVGNRVGYGTTMPTRGQLIYAHELLHNVGRFESGASGIDHGRVDPITDVVGWDVGGRLQSSAWSGSADRRKGSYYPIMAHQTTSDSWISAGEFVEVLDYLSDPDILALQNYSADNYQECRVDGTIHVYNAPCLSRGNIVFRGALLSAEEEVIVLRFPITQLSWLSQPTSSYSTLSSETPLRMEFRNSEEDAVLFSLPFDPTVTIFGNNGQPGRDGGFFEINIPKELLEGVDSMRIVDTETKQAIDFLTPEDYLAASREVIFPDAINPE